MFPLVNCTLTWWGGLRVMTAQLSSLSYSVCLLFHHVDVSSDYLFYLACTIVRKIEESKKKNKRVDGLILLKRICAWTEREATKMLLEKYINKNFTKSISSHFYCLNGHLLCTQNTRLINVYKNLSLWFVWWFLVMYWRSSLENDVCCHFEMS